MARRAFWCAIVAYLLAATTVLGEELHAYWAVITDLDVTSTIAPGKANWDPADPVTISGTIHTNGGEPCVNDGTLSNADSLVLELVGPDESNGSWSALDYYECEGRSHIRFTPGSDASGHFSFSIKGGGVSWVLGDGVETYRGAWIRLTFWKSGDKYIVSMGDDSTYPVLPGCSQSPLAETIYGQLASCDLNSSGTVDASDVTSFANYLGYGVTPQSGWQADYNHSGWVDGSDLSYLAGRLGKNCSSQKAGGDYAMDVRNLELAYLQDYLHSVGLTRAEVIAQWNAMGLSYDRDAAVTVLAGTVRRTEGAEAAPWSAVKTLYR
jgi:hypothetical protein